ncbi:MAG: phenolphthiocerol/phthiocerol/phthiodiolone dimycocerosyl transferase [Mycobacterium sp.]|nr:phenolphthiocerol/phthiocerol/phthiodiolone dimycocerosyl transferase [Mycobacterium sp.]
MFSSSVIRKLSRSEEIFAETESFVGLGADIKGHIDSDALSAAFDALLEAHPVLGAHLERGPDGRHQLAVDDLLHPGIEVVQIDDPAAESPLVRLNQSESLIQLRLDLRGREAQLTLYVHHSLADGHHEFSLVEELLSYYTDLICTGRIAPVTVQPAPDALEVVLAQRGIQKQRRSGLERFMPAMFAYDLPPSRRAGSAVKPSAPVRVPMAGCQLSERETRDLIALSRAHKVSLNGLLSAVLLMAEWRVRGRTNIPVPYLYPVDLRYVLSPPLSATACTNPLGVATYLAEIDHTTDVVSLARDIVETYRADVSDGVIQQSLLHFSPQYVGNPPGLPDVVMLTDSGLVPPVRTPPGVELTGTHDELFFAVDAGIDMYLSKIFAGQLVVEYHTHAPAPEKSIEAIHSVLRTVAEQQAETGVS